MLNECNGCEYQCNLSHIDICTLGSPCPHQRSTPMTNEEWLKSMDTEQFAEALAWIEDRGELPTVRKGNVKAFAEWLKQPHQ